MTVAKFANAFFCLIRSEKLSGIVAIRSAPCRLPVSPLLCEAGIPRLEIRTALKFLAEVAAIPPCLVGPPPQWLNSDCVRVRAVPRALPQTARPHGAAAQVTERRPCWEKRHLGP